MRCSRRALPPEPEWGLARASGLQWVRELAPGSARVTVRVQAMVQAWVTEPLWAPESALESVQGSARAWAPA
jgi:hypothetical protein